MINKFKIGFLVAVLSLMVGVSSANATASPLTFSNDTTVNIPAVGNFTILAGSGATSVIVDTSTLTVTTDGNNTLTLVSADRFLLTNSQSIAQACSPTTNTVIVPINTTSVVFTPVATPCPFNGGSGGLTTGTGGSSSGSTSGSTPGSTSGSTNNTPTIIITPVNPVIIAGCDNRTSGFSIVTGQSCATNTSTSIPVVTNIAGCNNGTNGFSVVTGQSCATNGSMVMVPTTTYNFGTATLQNGSRGPAVMELQRFLNRVLNLGLVVDGKLGPKTIAVIKKWQASHGLVADGLIGPKTKAMMNASVQ